MNSFWEKSFWHSYISGNSFMGDDSDWWFSFAFLIYFSATLSLCWSCSFSYLNIWNWRFMFWTLWMLYFCLCFASSSMVFFKIESYLICLSFFFRSFSSEIRILFISVVWLESWSFKKAILHSFSLRMDSSSFWNLEVIWFIFYLWCWSWFFKIRSESFWIFSMSWSFCFIVSLSLFIFNVLFSSVSLILCSRAVTYSFCSSFSFFCL